jgi:hypothetical protein
MLDAAREDSSSSVVIMAIVTSGQLTNSSASNYAARFFRAAWTVKKDVKSALEIYLP